MQLRKPISQRNNPSTRESTRFSGAFFAPKNRVILSIAKEPLRRCLQGTGFPVPSPTAPSYNPVGNGLCAVPVISFGNHNICNANIVWGVVGAAPYNPP